MEQSSTCIKEFYHNHSKEIRLSPRVLKIIHLVSSWIIGKSILDVGCGNKFITKCMGVYTDVDSIDIDEDIQIYTSDKQYDIVTCFDVLEHIEDLPAAVVNIKKLAKSLVIINQPEQIDYKQPLDTMVHLEDLTIFGKLIYLENYRFSEKEAYNFMVFERQKCV